MEFLLYKFKRHQISISKIDLSQYQTKKIFLTNELKLFLFMMLFKKNQLVQGIFLEESVDYFETLCILYRQAIQDKRQHNRSEKNQLEFGGTITE